jgi:hypothetical protein
MSLQYRRRVPVTRTTWLNLSRSGLSASRRVGRLTVNTRGGLRIRLGKGLFWRSGR